MGSPGKWEFLEGRRSGVFVKGVLVTWAVVLQTLAIQEDHDADAVWGWLKVGGGNGYPTG